MTNQQAIKELEKISTPIVYDAIEKFHIRSNTAFYTDDTIQCIFPEKGPLCAYACTAKITGAVKKGGEEQVVPSKAVWQYVNESPKPSVMVVEDADEDPKRACAWGDYSASIYGALGCKGTITNGFVRDIDVVRELPFQYFAKSTIAGHGYIRYKEIDIPVRIGGIVIQPQDILHADSHGIIVIPKEIELEELLTKVKECLDSEGKVISYCQRDDFTFEGLLQKVREHEERSGSHLKAD